MLGSWVPIIEDSELLAGNVSLQNHRVGRALQIFSQLLGRTNDADTRAALPRIRFQDDGKLQGLCSHEFCCLRNAPNGLPRRQKGEAGYPRTGAPQAPED